MKTASEFIKGYKSDSNSSKYIEAVADDVKFIADYLKTVDVKISPDKEENSPICLDDEEETPRNPELVSKVMFQQEGGPEVWIDIYQGWIDRIDGDQWISDDIIMFLCQRMIRTIPFSRMQILSSHFYQTIIKKKRIESWTNPCPLVVCIPVCENNHWVLIMVVSTSKGSTVFYMDSLNKSDTVGKIGLEVKDFIASMSMKVDIKNVKVPIQKNGIDCGLYVVSNFATIIDIMNSCEDHEIVKEMENRKFSYIMKRTSMPHELIDAFAEVLFFKSYWAKYSSEGAPELWWPCKRITERMASKIDKGKRKKSKRKMIPVIWFKKEKGDTIWVDPTNIRPIGSMTVSEAVQKYSFTEEEAASLEDAYRDATK